MLWPDNFGVYINELYKNVSIMKVYTQSVSHGYQLGEACRGN